jgi:hypothetical protein
MKIALVLLAVLAAAISALRFVNPPVVRHLPAEIVEIGKLPSGEPVRLIAEPPFQVEVPGAGAANLLPYVSRLTLADQSALRAEALAVWEVFDHGRESRWVLRPMRVSGTTAEAVGRDFVFERNANGVWKCRD